jgi:hypothetical protein
MSAAEIRQQLKLLELERLEAEAAGLIGCERYRRDLEQELEHCRSAFVGAAVSEIAQLRARLSAPLVG